jgi:hypothetical protein
MRHNWSVKPNEQIAHIWHKVWVCKICGCKKTQGCYKFAEPDYERNGQLYSHYIGCIDYEMEDNKTID